MWEEEVNHVPLLGSPPPGSHPSGYFPEYL
jgi:hypothetical protein